MAWFDIGVNLTDRRLDSESVLTNASKAEVTRLLVTGTDVDASTEAASLARAHPEMLLATAGVHPHYAKDVSGDYLEQLRKLAAQPQVVAIGECGLDFNRNFSPPAQQHLVFEQQLDLACELGLPVFLHERDAFDEQCALIGKYRDRLVGGVAHCFTGNTSQMHAYLQLGLYIGITGWVCDLKRGKALREAVTQLPLDRLMLETDAPYLMPTTLSSNVRVNEPANLPHIGAELAGLMGISAGQLQQHSYANACALFRPKDADHAV